MATLTKPNGIVIEYSYENRELLSQRVYKQGMVVLGTDTFTYYPNLLLKTAHGGLYNTDLDRSTLATDYAPTPSPGNHLDGHRCEVNPPAWFQANRRLTGQRHGSRFWKQFVQFCSDDLWS